MAEASPDRSAVVRFGPFTLDLRSGELSQNGARTRLQDPPLALLACLLEHPGQLVTRDELHRRLWPNETTVDFEHSVNTALTRLREALGDSADHPVYIETVPERGYRFLAVVEAVAREGAAAANAYRILDQLGAGGMGEVYLAEDLVLKRKVALKVLPAAVAGDPDRLARFRREAEVLASLNHPHICTLHAIGEAQPGELGVDAAADATGAATMARPYLVMEHIDGQTLAARIEKGPLPPALVCDVGAQIADALAAAHRHGVVHRDLKPANIMLTRTGSDRAGVPHVKLLDFGIAKLAGHGEQPAIAFDSAAETHGAGLTGQGTVLGTLPYMAPEQVEGHDADTRTDIWALGTVLYEMATGKPAFAADSFAGLAGRILAAEPAPMQVHQPLTPPALDRVVQRCLAKSPDDRWASAHDVAEQLRWIAQDGGRTAPAGGGSKSRRQWRQRAAWGVGLAGQTWEYLAAAREQIRLAPGGSFSGGGPGDAAVMLYYLNRPSEANELLRELAGRRDPIDWAIPEIRGHALHLAGRYDEQLEVAARAREQYPRMLYFHEHQAAALAAMGNSAGVGRAVDDTLAAQAESGTPGLVMLVAAMELRAHGRRPEADAMAERAAQWYGGQPPEKFVSLQTPNRGVEWYRSRPSDIGKRLREEHAMALQWAGRWEEARAIVAALRAAEPANVDYLGWHGVLAARRGDQREAHLVAERLRTVKRKYLFGSDLYWRACIAAQLGAPQEAVDLLTQAFSEGYWIQTQLHRTIDLEPLWGYAPFKEILRPKG